MTIDDNSTVRLSRRRTIADHITHLAFDDEPSSVDAALDDGAFHKSSSSDSLSTNTGKDSDAASIRSNSSALEHERAFVSRSLHKIYSKTKSTLAKIMPKTAESLNESLEVLAAFEVLSPEMTRTFTDTKLNPEIELTATVSQDNHITEEERKFQKDRLKFCRGAFARYIGVDVSEVLEEDIPIIAVAGSGGGFKAMLGTTGSLKAMEECGLYDCVMYISGVSGSCWTLTNLYRSKVNASPTKLAELFAATLPNNPGDPAHVQSTLAKDPLLRVPLTFGGMVHKRLSKLPRGVVDVYASLMQCHFFSSEETEWDPSDFKFSRQKRFMEGGKAPMPILTCIRHERPWLARVDKNAPEEMKKRIQVSYESNDTLDIDGKKAAVANQNAWWQWFEMSPLQIGSDELQAWIPTWSFGRKFKGGKSIDNPPEQNFSLIVGMVGSAMTAPFQTSCETLERSDPKNWIGVKVREHAIKLMAPDASMSVKAMLANHPFHSAYNWNAIYQIRPPPQPPGLVNSERIQLIDAGADNNQPLYPFTRLGRGVDIIIDLDSSEDVERNIVTPDIAAVGRRKGLNFTRTTPAPQEFPKDDKTTPLAVKYANRYCQVFQGTPTSPPGAPGPHGEPLAEKPVTLIYLPMLRNTDFTEFGPSDFSFAKLQYSKKEVEDMVKCAELNWKKEAELIRWTIKKCWEEKRDARLKMNGAANAMNGLADKLGINNNCPCQPVTDLKKQRKKKRAKLKKKSSGQQRADLLNAHAITTDILNVEERFWKNIHIDIDSSVANASNKEGFSASKYHHDGVCYRFVESIRCDIRSRIKKTSYLLHLSSSIILRIGAFHVFTMPINVKGT
ncbi:hypothetical protein HDU76_005048, partial [Blyttiomyces sp. JEL0837]